MEIQVHPIGKSDLSGASQRQRSQDSDEAVGFLKSRDDGEEVAEVLEGATCFFNKNSWDI